MTVDLSLIDHFPGPYVIPLGRRPSELTPRCREALYLAGGWRMSLYGNEIVHNETGASIPWTVLMRSRTSEAVLALLANAVAEWAKRCAAIKNVKKPKEPKK